MPLNRLALIILVASSTVAASGVCGQSLQEKVTRDQTLWIPNGDPDMAAAMQKARSTLSEFLALADAPRPSTSLFAVKVGIPAGEQHVEFFWIGPSHTRTDGFPGRSTMRPNSQRT